MNSQKRRNVFLILLVLAIGAFGALVLRPVPTGPGSDENVVTGRLAQVLEGGTNDVVFQLDGDDRRYYVNRGLENGLDLETLRRDAVGKDVTLKYPTYWTPLDWNNSTRHLSVVQVGDEILYSEAH